jgi:hypothetical protein
MRGGVNAMVKIFGEKNGDFLENHVTTNFCIEIAFWVKNRQFFLKIFAEKKLKKIFVYILGPNFYFG